MAQVYKSALVPLLILASLIAGGLATNMPNEAAVENINVTLECKTGDDTWMGNFSLRGEGMTVTMDGKRLVEAKSAGPSSGNCTVNNATMAVAIPFNTTHNGPSLFATLHLSLPAKADNSWQFQNATFELRLKNGTVIDVANWTAADWQEKGWTPNGGFNTGRVCSSVVVPFEKNGTVEFTNIRLALLTDKALADDEFDPCWQDTTTTSATSTTPTTSTTTSAAITTPATPDAEGGLAWWGIVLIVLGGLALAGAIGYGCYAFARGAH